MDLHEDCFMLHVVHARHCARRGGDQDKIRHRHCLHGVYGLGGNSKGLTLVRNTREEAIIQGPEITQGVCVEGRLRYVSPQPHTGQHVHSQASLKNMAGGDHHAGASVP